MNKKLKLSPEFPASIFPVRAGVYKCKWKYPFAENLSIFYNYFDGKNWYLGFSSPKPDITCFKNNSIVPTGYEAKIISWQGILK